MADCCPTTRGHGHAPLDPLQPPPTNVQMMDRLTTGLGLNREKLEPAFDMAKEMDDLDQFLADLDAPPRRRARRKP
jgi:hypothetical protein